MANKKTDYLLTIGTLVIIVSSLLASYLPWFHWVFMGSVIVVILYMYMHADTYSFHEVGSSKWKTYRYLSLFGLVCALCIYGYANFFVHENSRLHTNVFFPVLMAVFGNMAPKIGFNRTLGLRLPWTLENEETWRYAHRMIGYVTIPCVFIMMFSLLLSSTLGYMLSILAWFLIPAIASYRFSNKGEFSMKNRLYDTHFLVKAAFFVMIVGTIVLYPSLPNQLPMQFASDGSVNYTLPKMLGVCIIPLVGLFLTGYAKGNETNAYRGVLAAWLLTALDLGTMIYIAYIM